MNYDVYEVELDTGLPGYRLLQHIKAVDAADAQATVEAIQGAKAIATTFRRPCKPAEIAQAIKDGIVPDGTTATAVDAQGVPIVVAQVDEVAP